MDPIAGVVSALDRASVMEAWRASVSKDRYLNDHPDLLSADFPEALLLELDVDVLDTDDLPNELLSSLTILAEGMRTVGLTLRLISLLPNAVSLALEGVAPELRAVITQRAYAWINKCLLSLSSTALSALDVAAHVDELTGLRNKRGFDYDLRRLFQIRTSPTAMIFADVDGLKRINDAEGHEAGNQFLVDFARALTKTFRQSDATVYRWAGDEYAVLLNERPDTQLASLMNSVRSDFASFSWGHAIADLSDSDQKGFLERADRSMYENKALRETQGFRLPNGGR